VKRKETETDDHPRSREVPAITARIPFGGRLFSGRFCFDGSDHGISHGLGRRLSADVHREDPSLFQNRGDRAVDQPGRLCEGGIAVFGGQPAEHHRAREDGGDRIGQVLSGNRGGRAVIDIELIID
jgi:hypothetical protein